MSIESAHNANPSFVFCCACPMHSSAKAAWFLYRRTNVPALPAPVTCTQLLHACAVRHVPPTIYFYLARQRTQPPRAMSLKCLPNSNRSGRRTLPETTNEGEGMCPLTFRFTSSALHSKQPHVIPSCLPHPHVQFSSIPSLTLYLYFASHFCLVMTLPSDR